MLESGAEPGRLCR